jgi:hypothetical protein
MNSPTLYLEWQDKQASRRWFTIGRVRRDEEGLFEFVYTDGFHEAQRLADLRPLIGFGELQQVYRSASLFPQFENRLLSASREEFTVSLERLGLLDASDPLAVLARSSGKRETDQFQLYPKPIEVRDEAGERSYSIQFFAHGSQYVPNASAADSFTRPLRLLWDFQNPKDKNALMVMTDDNRLLGWIPRHYSADLIELRSREATLITTLSRYNAPPAPSWYRFLLTVQAKWPEGFEPLRGIEHRPIPGK